MYSGARIEKATIVVNQKHIDTYRNILKKRRIFVKEENFNEKENITVFLVENLTQADIHQFNENDSETCYIHFQSIRIGKIKIELSTVDTSRPQKYVSYGIVGYFIDKEEEQFQKIAEIYADREIMAEKPNGYHLNWGAWGSVNLATAKGFSEGIDLCTKVMEDLEKEYC